MQVVPWNRSMDMVKNLDLDLDPESSVYRAAVEIGEVEPEMMETENKEKDMGERGRKKP